MAIQVMPRAMAYSPTTIVTVGIGQATNTITVADGTAFPAGGGFAVLSNPQTGQRETIFYAARTGNNLTGVLRAVEDSDQQLSWNPNTEITRMFTAIDHNRLIDNVTWLEQERVRINNNVVSLTSRLDTITQGHISGVGTLIPADTDIHTLALGDWRSTDSARTLTLSNLPSDIANAGFVLQIRPSNAGVNRTYLLQQFATSSTGGIWIGSAAGDTAIHWQQLATRTFSSNAANLTSGLIPVARIPNLSAALLTSGTLATARMVQHRAAPVNIGPTANQTLSPGATFIVPQVNANEGGAVTAMNARTMTMPATYPPVNAGVNAQQHQDNRNTGFSHGAPTYGGLPLSSNWNHFISIFTDPAHGVQFGANFNNVFAYRMLQGNAGWSSWQRVARADHNDNLQSNVHADRITEGTINPARLPPQPDPVLRHPWTLLPRTNTQETGVLPTGSNIEVRRESDVIYMRGRIEFQNMSGRNFPTQLDIIGPQSGLPTWARPVPDAWVPIVVEHDGTGQGINGTWRMSNLASGNVSLRLRNRDGSTPNGVNGLLILMFHGSYSI